MGFGIIRNCKDVQGPSFIPQDLYGYIRALTGLQMRERTLNLGRYYIQQCIYAPFSRHSTLSICLLVCIWRLSQSFLQSTANPKPYVIATSIMIANRCVQTPPWLLVFVCLTKRIHSIFVLRLFNDCFAMLFLYLAVYLFMHRRW